MPLPKPHPHESEQDYASRCIAFVVDDGTVENTPKGREQGAAMCFQNYRDSKKAAAPQGDYGNVEYADPGFQEDKKPRYPLDTEQHIRAAWSYIHQADNRKLYTAAQLTHIENKIIAAWKKKIDPAGPPSAKSVGMQRAYSFLEIKSFDEEQRIIEGIASTPTPDRVGDIVRPLGAKFKLPMPLLWQHKADKPIGQVFWAQATEAGIPFKAKIAQLDTPGTLKDRLDEAWQSIKLGLVRAVSIGFNPIKHAFMKEGGMDFQEWEFLELSAVTIPANIEATINVVRSIDQELRAATGPIVPNISSYLAAPGPTIKPPASVLAKTSTTPQRKNTMAKQTIAEQISAFELQRGTKAARLEELMTKATDESRTLEDNEREEYDTLESEVEQIDGHLVRMRKLDRMNAAAAKPVVTDNGGVEIHRNNPIISVRPNRPKENGLVRVAIAKMAAAKFQMSATEFARDNWPDDSEVLAALKPSMMKTAVNPLDTTTSAKVDDFVPAATHLGSEFVEFLRPLTVIGRLPGIRRVPFNVKIPVQTGGSTVDWVGELNPKPLSGITSDNITLRWAKCAGIVTFSDELARFSSPAIETLVRDDMAAQIVQFLDEQFLSPAVAEVSNVSPASITNGGATDTATGTSAANLRTDIKDALLAFNAANIPLNGIVVIMQESQAALIANIMTSLETQAFPGMGLGGGALGGMPCITSNSCPSGDVIFVKPSEILLADDGGINVDVSNQATLVMSDNPTTTDSATYSLWQRNAIGVRVERYITWAKRRSAAVYYYTACNYGG